MRHSTRLGAVLTAIVAAGAAAFAAAAPAAAAPTSFKIFLPDVTVAPGPGGTTNDVLIQTDQPGILTNVTFTIDASALTSIGATVTLDEGGFCTTSGAVSTCTWPEVEIDGTGLRGLPTLTITADAKATPGAAASVTISATADGVPTATTHSRVTIGEAVDLQAGPSSETSAPPGARVSDAVTVRNVGTTTAHGVVLLVYADRELAPTHRYRNCRYGLPTMIVCTFGNDLAPGLTYQADPTPEFMIDPQTHAPFTTAIESEWLTPDDWSVEYQWYQHSGGPALQPGSGDELTLRQVANPPTASVPQTDTNPYDNWSDITVHVTGNHGADLAAVGATASGGVGASVTVKVGVKNLGPAMIDTGRSGEPYDHVGITIPAGTTATAVPARCAPVVDGSEKGDEEGKPGYAEYYCATGVFLAVGDTESFSFTLRIDRAVTDARGVVHAHDSRFAPANPDGNPANDEAAIVINPSTTGGGTGGGLPVTGARAGLLAGIGVLLILAGIGGYLVNRRRVRFVADE